MTVHYPHTDVEVSSDRPPPDGDTYNPCDTTDASNNAYTDPTNTELNNDNDNDNVTAVPRSTVTISTLRQAATADINTSTEVEDDEEAFEVFSRLFKTLPQELVALTFDFVQSTTDKATLFRLIRTSKTMHDTHIPTLYREIKLNANMASHFFRGLSTSPDRTDPETGDCISEYHESDVLLKDKDKKLCSPFRRKLTLINLHVRIVHFEDPDSVDEMVKASGGPYVWPGPLLLFQGITHCIFEEDFFAKLDQIDESLMPDFTVLADVMSGPAHCIRLPAAPISSEKWWGISSLLETAGISLHGVDLNVYPFDSPCWDDVGMNYRMFQPTVRIFLADHKPTTALEQQRQIAKHLQLVYAEGEKARHPCPQFPDYHNVLAADEDDFDEQEFLRKVSPIARPTRHTKMPRFFGRAEVCCHFGRH